VSLRGARLAALALACAAPAAPALAAPPPVLLPSAFQPLSPEPPLRGTAVGETRFRGHVASRELVLVTQDAARRVHRVRVQQRLLLPAVGDYVFSIPGPIVDVRRLPGSQSSPGLRQATLVWAGFSPGGRVIAAEVRLDARRAARVLPLRLRV